VRHLRGADKTVVATVALRGRGFIAEVKQRTDCTLVELIPAERERLFARLSEGLAQEPS